MKVIDKATGKEVEFKMVTDWEEEPDIEKLLKPIPIKWWKWKRIFSNEINPMCFGIFREKITGNTKKSL